jgi:hypothetical protein
MFVSFAAGERSLPPIPLGDVTLRDIEVSTLSVLKPDETLRLSPPRGQAVLPSTWPALLVLFAAVAGCAVAVAALVIIFRNLAVNLRESRMKRLPARRLARSLRMLFPRRSGIDSREFVIGISDIARRYIEERLGFPALSSTTKEIRELFERGGVNRSAEREAAAILRETDDVKFGGGKLDAGGMRAVAERLANLPRLIDAGEGHVER